MKGSPDTSRKKQIPSSQSVVTLSGVGLLALFLPTVCSAALIHHYTFDVSVGADSGTTGGRTLTEQTRGTGGTVSLVTSVTDTNGLTRSGVLRLDGETPISAGVSDTTNGSWMENNSGSTVALSNFTVALWYRTDHNSNNGFSSVFSNGTGAGGGTDAFQLDNGDNNITPDQIRYTGQSGTLADTTTFALNTWIHVALTYDGVNTKYYINGEQFGGDLAGNPGNAFQQIRVGSNRGESRLFDGDFDDLQIHDVALSDAQITAMVPEPSTFSLALLGLLGCVLRRKR